MDDFENVYHAYFDQIFRFVHRRVADIHDVEDIVSNIFEAVWLKRKGLSDSAHLKNWIYNVTVNKVNDFLRKKYQADISYNLEELEDKPMDDQVQANPQKEQYIDRINQAVEKLSKSEQFFYRLKYQENCTIKEICQQMEISESNAKVINNRLVKKLQSIINHHE